MQTLVRIDRWVIGLCTAIAAGSFAYAFLTPTLVPPIPGIGNPKYIEGNPVLSTAVYHIENQSYSDIDIRLQIKGFKREQGASSNFFFRGRTERVFVYPGQFRMFPNGTSRFEPVPNVISLIYSVRPKNWGYFWHRFKSDLTRRRRR